MWHLKKLTKMGIVTAILALSATFVWGVWQGLERKGRQWAGPGGEKPDAEMKLTDMEYTEMEEGRRRWTIKASEVHYFQEERKTLLSLVDLVLFLENGDKIYLKSNKGIVYADTKNIDLWDSVRATVPDEYELRTEKASYRHEERVVFSSSPIRISGPELRLQGKQWKYMLSEQRTFLEGEVEATFTPNSPGAGQRS